MKREIPLLIVGISGFAMLIQYFIPTDWSEFIFTYAQDWVIVIGILALPLGIWSLVKANVEKLKVPGERFYSAVLLIGFLVMVLTGLKRESLEYGTAFMTIFTNVLIPIQATIFSLLAFFIASAAYRAFRARSVLATILLLTAFIIMFRFIPLGPISTVNLSAVAWTLSVPNMAAKRAIMMGIGLGATATAIKIILGIERTYMGHD
ncbi:MAG: hypothetical protein B6D58_06585 [candidate division Zixibacteria bacterium 4484_95]|nr:MAG: hypothetical protein B6D58_06585 [candidate division Zixibacteria bacterium 4484_95]